MQVRWTGYAPLMATRLDVWFFDKVLIIHQPTNGKPAFYFSPFLLSERHDRYNDPKTYKSNHNLSEKKNHKRQASHLRAHAVQIRGYNFRSKFAKLSGAWQKCHLLVVTCFICTCNRCSGSISWWVANRAIQLNIDLLLVSSALLPRQISPRPGAMIFSTVILRSTNVSKRR